MAVDGAVDEWQEMNLVGEQRQIMKYIIYYT